MLPVPAVPLVIALLVAATSLTGIVTLGLAPDPLADSSATLVAAGMAMAALVTLAGLLVARGRWSRHLGTAVSVTWIVIGVVLESAAGYGLIALGAVAVAATTGPWLGGWLRHLARVDGAPPAAVTALLALTLTPAASGLAAPGGVHAAAWAFAAWSVVLAFALARIVPGSLTAARIVHPAAAMATALVVGSPAAIAPLLSGAVVTAMCWRRDVSLAVVPIVAPGGTALRIPPELAPADVLAAAGADAAGRRRP